MIKRFLSFLAAMFGLPTLTPIKTDAGVQLRPDTVSVINTYKPYHMFCNKPENVVPLLYGTILTMISPSYAGLVAFVDNKVPGNLGYGPEGWDNTPEEEKKNVVLYHQKSADLAHVNGKLLVSGAGSNFLDGLEKTDPNIRGKIAAVCDMVVIQGQRYQGKYGLDGFRVAIQDIITKIRAGNKTCPIWVQLSLTPGQGAVVYTPEEVLQFRDEIKDLVAGCTIYDLGDPNKPAQLIQILKLWK